MSGLGLNILESELMISRVLVAKVHYACIFTHVYTHIYTHTNSVVHTLSPVLLPGRQSTPLRVLFYGVATISMLLKIIGLFCKRAL